MFIVFFVALAIAYGLTFPTIWLAKKLRLVTDASKRKHPAHVHVGIVPRAGGLPIYLAILITVLLFLPLNKILVGILIASSILVAQGLLDDYFDLSPYVRIVINVFVAALVVSFGLGIPYISNPFGGVIHLDTWRITFEFFGKHSILVFADLMSILWLTWLMNMVNWSKGVDGQLPGFVAITAFFLGLLAQKFTGHDINAYEVMLLSFIISGAFIGFLPFNFYPQKIMPGYGGGSLAGFLLGVLSVLSFGKVGTAVLILAVPMLDAFYTIVRRIHSGHSPFRGDRGHLHHRLMDIGWGKRRIAVFYWNISLILGICSLFLRGFEKLLAFCAIAVVLVTFIVIINRMKAEQSSRNSV